MNDNLCLPNGYPFKEVQSAHYWWASTFADVATAAWFVDFVNGGVLVNAKGDGSLHAW